MSDSERATFVVVEVGAADVDVVSGLAWGAGAVGVEERAGADGDVELRIAVDPDDGAEPLLAVLGERWTCRVESVPTDGLLDAWREHATAVRVGANLVVRPAWVAALSAEPGDVEVVLDPGRTFGSGGHPSTRLALALIEHAVAPGSTVLDVGCGSGVLAIAAARLGAPRCDAIDVELDAVVATAENAARNGVQGAVRASATPVERIEATYEVVAANLLAHVLIELADPLVARVASGGALVLAGLLDRDVDRVIGAVTDAAVGAGRSAPEVVRRQEETGLGATWAGLHLRIP